MRIEQASAAGRLRPLKLALREVPHLTIETNRTCNLRCRSCYTLDKTHVKKPADVKHEVDIGLRKRNLDSITLLGGEPTLYPALDEIIRYVKSKKLNCQLLTNGVKFLEPGGGALLARLAAAGVDRILLHADNGQTHERGDIEDVRKRLFEKMEKAGIPFGLSLTITSDRAGELPRLLRHYAPFSCFGGILAILHREPGRLEQDRPDMGDEYRSLRERMGIEPTVYIPTSLDDGTVGWLIYFYYLDVRTGRTFGVSPAAYALFVRVFRFLKGHRPFTLLQPPSLRLPSFLSLALLECALDPGRIRQARTFFSRRAGLPARSALRFHLVAIQTPPRFDARKNAYEFCRGCPDATIRNGKLTPVCVADLISPFPGGAHVPVDRRLYRDAYEHLGEI